MKKVIPVVGMACSACSANVERKLQSLAGVVSASVSLPTRSALVEWDENAITLEEMKKAVNAIGFDLVIEEDRSVAEIERREYVILRRKVLLSWCFALLVMAISMGWLHLGDRSTEQQTAMLLAFANLVVCGREFYAKAWKQLIHRTASMDTLVALSTGISFLFSVVNTFWGDRLWTSRGIAWHTYYDASVMIITFVLTGRLLEQHARRSTASAIRQLMGMTPKTARLYKGEQTAADGTKSAIVEEVPISTCHRGSAGRRPHPCRWHGEMGKQFHDCRRRLCR